MTALTDWRQLYKGLADDQNDFASEVRSSRGYISDPVDTVQLAAASVETSEALVQALGHPWALYTPQEAAHVASALFGQLEATAAALSNMRQVFQAMAERGDVHLPAASGANTPAGENLSDALDRLAEVAEEVSSAVRYNAGPSVAAIEAAPSSAALPDGCHEVLEAVAALLGDEAKLIVRHEPGEHDLSREAEGFGCGCSVEITHAGQAYDLHRGDSEWSLVRESDGKSTFDGGTTWTHWISLKTTLETAHPSHLVDLVRESLA